MSSPANDNGGALMLTESDIVVDGDEPRVSHHVLAERMEVDAQNLKRVISSLEAEDEYFGALIRSEERLVAGLGWTTREHVLLSEGQAIKVVLGSKSKRRFALQHALVTLFLAVKRGQAQATQLRATTDAAHSLLVLAGVKAPIASAVLLKSLEAKSGLDMEHARRVLPADTSPSERLNATKLGAELGVTARTVNQRLAAAGMQIKGERDPWMLTDLGKQYGEAVPFSSGKHAGNQILWRREVLKEIQ